MRPLRPTRTRDAIAMGRWIARGAAALGLALVALSCSLPLGGLGIVGPEGGSPEASSGVEGIDPSDTGTMVGEAGGPGGDDASDATTSGGDGPSWNDAMSGDDATDQDAGVDDAADGPAQPGDERGVDEKPDAEGGTVAKPDAGPEAGDAEGGVHAAPTLVQSSYATPQTPQTSLAVDFTMPQRAGDLNVVIVGWADSVATVRSVSDGAGNVYALAVGPTVAPGAFTQSIYYAGNIGPTAGKNTVTVQFNGAASFADVRILEYQGIDANNPLDVGAGSAGVGSPSSAGPIVTTAADLLVAANTVQALTSGPGPGFTQRILTMPDSDIVEDRFVSAPASYSATAPVTAASRWVMQIAAFRAK